MESAGSPRSEKLAFLLGGLQAGMLGALFSAAWLALGSAFMGRGFWGASNAVATVLNGGSYRRGFHFSSIAGLALEVIVYSALGGAIALALRDRLPRFRRTLSCIVLALSWFYVAYGLIWPHLAPVALRVQPFSMALVGHIIYGGILSRFPAYAGALAEFQTAPQPELEPVLSSSQTGAAPDPQIPMERHLGN
jgi:hypothetical protein